MVVLFCFLLALFTPTHEWRPLVLDPVVSFVFFGVKGSRDHPARDPCALASCAAGIQLPVSEFARRIIEG